MKFFAIIGVFMLSILSVFAYTPSTELVEKMDIVVERIEDIIDVKGESYRTRLLSIIETYKTKYSSNERSTYILEYLYDNLQGEVITMLDSGDMTDEEFIAQMTSYFDSDVLAEDITIKDCTLSAGTESRCYAITIVGDPVTDADIGPYCPSNISDDDSQGGIWLNNGTAYDVDGAFIQNLANFYDDNNWQLYNEDTGEINVTIGQEECEAAANPQVDEDLQNHCVQCMLAYLEDFGETTYYIPVIPVDQSSPSSTPADGIGLAFNGIKYDVSAPIENILSAYTIAAFDDCGGHVNPRVGYHYHAYQSDNTDCSTHYEIDDHTDFIGFALDGYKIYGQDDSLTDLDSCGGHFSDSLGYHYHIDGDSNEQLGCFTGEYSSEYASSNSRGPGAGGPGGGGDRPAGPPTR